MWNCGMWNADGKMWNGKCGKMVLDSGLNAEYGNLRM